LKNVRILGGGECRGAAVKRLEKVSKKRGKCPPTPTFRGDGKTNLHLNTKKFQDARGRELPKRDAKPAAL